MAHKDDLTEIVLGQIVGDRLDGICQSNGFSISWAITPGGWCEHFMAIRPYRTRQGLEFPSAMPRAVNQDIGTHVLSPLAFTGTNSRPPYDSACPCLDMQRNSL
jgi:hypothetical protein